MPRSRIRLALVVATLVLASCASETPSAAKDPQFAKMDANGDGRISHEEHASGASQMFGMMDGDTDGKVTATEMDAAHERITGAKASPSDMPAGEKIKVVDADGDGILTAAEHAAGSTAMFDKMDADKDRALSEAEFVAGHAPLKK